MVRAGRHQLRAVAAGTGGGQAIKVAARAHQTLIWERTRHTLRLRSALREFFPAALVAYADPGLTGTGTLELLTRAPAPAAAAKLTTAQISAALKRARRRDVPARAQAIKDALRAPQLAQPAAITAAYAAAMQAAAAVLITLNEQISRLDDQVEAHFLQHPDAEISLSQPGIGTVNGARVLAGFGDAPGRYASAKARKNYAGSSPITRASGRSNIVLARYIRNDRLTDALHSQALSAPTTSPGARAYHDKQRAPRPRPQRRPPPAQQPPRRHPPRLPENPHPLRRNNRLATHHRTHHTPRRLTSSALGMSSRAPARAAPLPG